ncbi:MAG: ABC transporter permease [Vicinamibacteria bacterium]
MDNVWRDIQYGLRMLRKSKGFTAIAVLTLALGIGANTAVFSVVNAVLLRPLPYDGADRLVFMTEWSEQVPEMSFSVANFKDLRDQNQVFDAVMGSNSTSFILTGVGPDSERVNVRQVTSGMFETLQKAPLIGRAFTADEDKPGAPRVILLSEGFWERRFGRDPGVIGRALTLSDESFTVIGVMPGTFHSSWKTTDAFTPLLWLEDKLGGENQRGNHPGIYAVGRLKKGVTVEQARTDVKALAKRLTEEHPLSNARQSMTVEPLLDAVIGDLKPAMFLLLGAVLLVLLIACANVANLLLARAADRQREVALRMAVGGNRWRLIRQLLTESVLLSTLGGLVGIGLAYAGVRALVASLPANVPRADEIGLDGTVLAFTAFVALLTGLVFGLAPAWKVSSTDINDTLKETGRGTATPGQHRLRNALVITEISLALVLLIGAGLLLRSFFHVIDADNGIRSTGVLADNLPMPPARFAELEKRTALIEQVLAQIQAAPGVRSVAVTSSLLGGNQSSFNVEGRPEPLPGQRPSADLARVTPDYFKTMGVRLVEGRVFANSDRADTPPICVIDELFAKTHFAGESSLGKRVKFGGLQDMSQPWMEVVGVVAHVKNYGVDQPSRSELYQPFYQRNFGTATILVQTAGDPASLTSGVREAVRRVDPELPLYAVRTLDEIISSQTAQRRLAVELISVFAAVALLLAAIGIYGVMSYAVALRTQEIGIRMALGAERSDISKMVLRFGVKMSFIGIAVGLVAAFGLARTMAGMLFQTSVADPPTFSVVPLVLMGVALLACYVPARRATRVDPLVALRAE